MAAGLFSFLLAYAPVLLAQARSAPQRLRKRLAAASFGVLSLGAGVLIWDMRASVPPGRIGIVLPHTSGQMQSLPPGAHWIAPYSRMDTVSAGLHAFEIGAPDGLLVFDRSGESIKVKASLLVALDPARAPLAHQRFGADPAWGNRVRAAGRTAAAKAVARMSAHSAEHSPDQLAEEIAADLHALLTEEFLAAGLTAAQANEAVKIPRVTIRAVTPVNPDGMKLARLI